jgi:hypothetical protein
MAGWSDAGMWRWGLALVLAGALAPGALAEEPGAPRLEIEETERSFGVVTPDFFLEEAFVLRNVGESPLAVEVLPPAGRARVLESPEEIPPGEEGRVRVQADLRRQRGPLEIPFTVTSNDPEQPHLRLVLVGEVKDYIATVPGHGRWLMVQGEADGTIRQTLVAEDSQLFEVTGVELPREGMRATHRQEGDGWVVELTVDRWAPIGPVTGEAVIHTTHPEQPRILVPVSGYVRPILVVDPEELVGEVELEEEVEQEIRISSFATDPFELLEVQHELPGVPPARVVALQEGRIYAVFLTFGPEVPKGRLKSELRILTDNPNVPEIRIPVDAEIR